MASYYSWHRVIRSSYGIPSQPTSTASPLPRGLARHPTSTGRCSALPVTCNTSRWSWQWQMTRTHNIYRQALACVYSSETGVWGDLVAAPLPPKAPTSNLHVVVSLAKPAVLVENSLYWILAGDLVGILEFALERKNIAVIQPPVDVFTPVDVHTEGKHKYTVMRAEGGGLGFLYFSKSDCIAQLWKRMTHCGGVAFWVLDRTIELDKLLPLNSLVERTHLWILGFAEGNNVVFLWTFKGIFMIHLESLQSHCNSRNLEATWNTVIIHLKVSMLQVIA